MNRVKPCLSSFHFYHEVPATARQTSRWVTHNTSPTKSRSLSHPPRCTHHVASPYQATSNPFSFGHNRTMSPAVTVTAATAPSGATSWSVPSSFSAPTSANALFRAAQSLTPPVPAQSSPRSLATPSPALASPSRSQPSLQEQAQVQARGGGGGGAAAGGGGAWRMPAAGVVSGLSPQQVSAYLEKFMRGVRVPQLCCRVWSNTNQSLAIHSHCPASEQARRSTGVDDRSRIFILPSRASTRVVCCSSFRRMPS